MRRPAVVFLVLLAAVAAAVEAPAWPSTLPALKLKDPLGQEHTQAALEARGAVMVVTAPTHAQGDAQQAWNAALEAARGDARGPVLVFLEDMSQSWFRPLVLSRMRESYKPGSGLLLLLDEGGVTRKALGVPENTTMAFAFAPGGRLVAVETQAASAARAQALVRAAARAP